MPDAHVILGFDYNFNAIHDETNELFVAYKEMFEIAISQRQGVRAVLGIYFPVIQIIFVSLQQIPECIYNLTINLAGQCYTHSPKVPRSHRSRSWSACTREEGKDCGWRKVGKRLCRQRSSQSSP